MIRHWTISRHAISRLRIPYGTSLVYPLSSMTSHVVGTKEVWGGDYLQATGLLIPRQANDFQSTLWELQAVAR